MSSRSLSRARSQRVDEHLVGYAVQSGGLPSGEASDRDVELTSVEGGAARGSPASALLARFSKVVGDGVAIGSVSLDSWVEVADACVLLDEGVGLLHVGCECLLADCQRFILPLRCLLSVNAFDGRPDLPWICPEAEISGEVSPGCLSCLLNLRSDFLVGTDPGFILFRVSSGRSAESVPLLDGLANLLGPPRLWRDSSTLGYGRCSGRLHHPAELLVGLLDGGAVYPVR